MLEHVKGILDSNIELLKIYARDLENCDTAADAVDIAGFLGKASSDLATAANAIYDADEELDTRADFLQTLTVISDNLAAIITAGADAEKVAMLKNQVDNKIAEFAEDGEEI